MSRTSPSKPRSRRAKLILLAIIALAVALLAVKGVDIFKLGQTVLFRIRDAGPAVYFTAMALLPAVGVPMLSFTLTAGPMFAERLGLGTVVFLSLLAITVNFVLSYFLARRAMRPVVHKLMTWLGYQLPDLDEKDATDITIIMRVTPGIPFFAQNYLLGLAGVSFTKYLLITCIFTWTLSAAFVVFGDALVRGQGKMALVAASLLVAATCVTHLIRRHYGKKKKSAGNVPANS